MEEVDDLKDIKSSLNFLAEEVTTIRTQQKTILELVNEVKILKTLLDEKNKRITHLENKVEDLEQYTRRNDVIVTGLKIQPRSYAHAVSSDRDRETDQDATTMEQQVAVFLRSKGIEMDCNKIEACHPLPRRRNVGNTAVKHPAIIIRFVNRKDKAALLKQGRKLRGTNVFINEHLTKQNADLARKARNLRKEGKIQSTWTNNCKVFIKTNGATPEEEKVLLIRKMEELEKY